MNYIEKLTSAIRSSNSLLCIGLDPVAERLPLNGGKNILENTAEFCRTIIRIGSRHCCAFKLNLAFFEALGPDGLHVFSDVLAYIPDDKIIIADAKRGDIATSARQYKQAFFDHFRVDAITLNPLMGMDTLQPFLQDASRAVYALTLTSNPGAADFLLQPCGDFNSLSCYIADKISQEALRAKTHIGMVIGATKTGEFKQVITCHPEGSLLIPGIGAQGGRIDTLASRLENHPGIPVITSSRSIIYAGEHEKNWETHVENKACEMKSMLEPLTMQYV